MVNNKLKYGTLIQDMFPETGQSEPESNLEPSKLHPTSGLEAPSQSSITRLEQIPLLSSTPAELNITPGIVAYDSWTGANAISLRDASDGHIRNVILDAGNFQLDLVGEMRASFWDFVARLYRNEEVIHDFALQAGRKRMLPDASGFFTWKSKSVVRNLKLISYSDVLEFEEVPW